ncbi:hypothetical protein TRSC58_06575 [Trypanosoma rangeli SC58]|uniref:Uncharacterized protein n=1 Tax=Trypanosoma rangeli SC58 TaxID=429131 RepID=A0A061ISE7_TRYRA|nr:hypothetical protein TRSC58_06575 [Trypanosoma rangeli SC58]
MAFRGHRLHLIDGVCARSAPSAAEDVNWLCILTEDVGDECAAAGLLGDWLPLGLQKAAGDAAAVVRFAEVRGDAVCEKRGTEGASRDGGDCGDDAAVRALLGVVGDAGVLVACRLSLGEGDDELMATSLASASRNRAPLGGPPPQEGRRADGAGHRQQQEFFVELRVPASAWQLDLLRSLAARGGGGGPQLCAAPLPPQLLESVAYGNVFDASLASALAASPGGRQLLEGVKERVVRSGAFLGDAAFPVLAVVRAVLADVLAAPSAEERASRQRRVVLSLPGAGGATGDAAAYLHAVQRFLQPWHLFTLAMEARRRQPSVAALLDSRAWLEAGGVLLLNPADPLCRQSSLEEEADVVITCGKAAAALVAGRRCGVPHIALHSEVELAECPAPRWTLWQGAAGEAEATDAERAVLAGAVAVGGAGAAPVLATAAALLRQLGPPAAGKGKPTRVVGVKRRRGTGIACDWTHLRRIAAAIALCSCRIPVEFVGDSVP